MNYGCTLQKLDTPDNELLSALPPEDCFCLLSGMERVQLRHGEILSEADSPIQYAFFPEQALIYLVNDLEDGKSAEIGVIGNRGLLGIPLALGTRTSFHRAVVQVPGAAMRMKADTFIAEFERGGRFRRIVLDYTWRVLLMTSQYAACNRVHMLKQRLARLLLTAHDHVGCREFPMTHEFMGQLLGSPRSEVSKIAAGFRHAGQIQYTRGKLRVLRREGLESEVCECYSTVAAHLKNQLVGR